MTKTILFFEDTNGVNHIYKLYGGFHYRTYPTEDQIRIEVLDNKGEIIARTETKLEYFGEHDLEILEEIEFLDVWNLDIPDCINDYIISSQLGSEIKVNLNCVEDFITEIIQENMDVVLNDIHERHKQMFK